jgi:hypothetical protein
MPRFGSGKRSGSGLTLLKRELFTQSFDGGVFRESVRMLIQSAIRAIVSVPDNWVRLVQLHRTGGGIELRFDVHKGKQGKRTDSWSVACRGVRETNMTEFDGGGLAVYPGTHPAARQYWALKAELKWPLMRDDAKMLGVMYRAHATAVDDWIPFDRYSFAAGDGVCQGPDFLLQAYARALKLVGEQVQLTVRRAARKVVRPRVLHFGASYIVADTFTAERLRP